MISVYYNEKYGFLIVPNAIERAMGCYISIEPTIEIMAEETIDKIGSAIKLNTANISNNSTTIISRII